MEYKDTPETYAASPKGLKRLGRLKWWYIVFVVFGVAIAVIVLGSPTHPSFQVTTMAAREGSFDPKPIIMVAIIGVLLITLLGSVWTMLRSSNASNIQAASDVTKALVGFFIGVATKFFGP